LYPALSIGSIQDSVSGRGDDSAWHDGVFRWSNRKRLSGCGL